MEYCHFVSFFVCVSFLGEGKKERAIDLRHVQYYEIICFELFLFAQLLVAFVAELCKL